jgi:transcriptional regulator with XRE-family HTH domain
MAEGGGVPDTIEVKKRRLRSAVRQARIKAKMTQQAAADELVWSTSKIVRIEQGIVPVTPTDVRALLQLYRVTDKSRIDELVELAKSAREDKGWSTFNDVHSAAALELFGNEPAAKVIYKYEASVIPGLFQTEDYARSLLRALGNSEEQIERRLEARLQRQWLLDSPLCPDLNFIIGETALARPAGDDDVMREQLAHLLELIAVGAIFVLVLPFTAGPHRGIGSAFTVLQFDDPLLPDLLYLENWDKDSVSHNEKEIRDYLELFVELQNTATRYGSAEDHIKRVIRERYSGGKSAT